MNNKVNENILEKNEILSGRILKMDRVKALETVSCTLKKDSNLSMAIRNGFYIKLLASSELEFAKNVLGIILRYDPENVIILRDSASLSLKLGELNLAYSYIQKALALKPTDKGVLEHALQVLLVTNNASKAVDVAFALKDVWYNSSRVCLMSMNALYRGGKEKEACQAAIILLEIDSHNSNSIVSAVSILISCSKLKLAKEALLISGAQKSKDERVLYELARVLFELDSRDPNIVKVAETYKSLAKEPTRINFIVAKHFAACGKNKLAIDLLLKNKKLTSSMRHVLAKCLISEGKLNEAIDNFRKLLIDCPKNKSFFREYISLLMISSRKEEASNLYHQQLESRSVKLPASFDTGIESILIGQYFHKIPHYRKDWVYDNLLKIGKKPYNRKEWEKKLDQMNAIDHFILEWLECKPGAIEEIYPFFENFESQLAGLRKELKNGRGAFIASAHVGLLFGGPVALKLAGIESNWLASVPDLNDNRFEGTLISTTTSAESSVAREILKSLNNNSVVAIACDGDKGLDKSVCKLFDQNIELSNFIPKLSYRKKIASFFPLVFWKEKSIRIELVELPFPNEHEKQEDFTLRWFESFSTNLEQLFYNNSTALRGTGGFWTKLKN